MIVEDWKKRIKEIEQQELAKRRKKYVGKCFKYKGSDSNGFKGFMIKDIYNPVMKTPDTEEIEYKLDILFVSWHKSPNGWFASLNNSPIIKTDTIIRDFKEILEEYEGMPRWSFKKEWIRAVKFSHQFF